MDIFIGNGARRYLAEISWYGGLFQDKTYARKDLDRWAVKQGKTSITPMKLDLADREYLAEKSS